MSILDETPPVCGACGDRDPFCCGGEGEQLEPTEPDPAEELRREYATVAEVLYKELDRHARAHGCNREPCELHRALRGVWVDTIDMSWALDFVLLGKVPMDTHGRPRPGADWVKEYVPGPWADDAWAHQEFMTWCRRLAGEARP